MKWNESSKEMKYSKEIKIGAFVIGVIVMSFFLINYLRGEDLLNRENDVVARYDDLGGLTESAPVYIKGYKAGKVTDITYDSVNGDFRVTCSILKDFVIPTDSRMIIYGVDIMGGKGIRIELGKSDELLADGGMLLSSSEPALLDGLASSVTPLISKVSNTLDSLNMTVAGVNSLLASKNQAHITRTLAHLESTMDNVSSIVSSVEGKSSELNAFADNLSILSEKFVTIAEKVDTTVTGVSSLVSSLENSEIEGVMKSFRTLLENINDPDGTIGRLLTEDSVYDSVDELLSDIDALVKKIQENPKKYLRISVF